MSKKPENSPNIVRRGGMFPKKLSQSVEYVTKPALKANGLAGSRILTHWASIAGPSLSKHVLPVKLNFPRGKKTDGTLTVAVRPGFAPQLSHQQPMMIERIAQYFGYQAISRIQIIQQWPSEPARKEMTAKKGLSKEAASLVATIEDDELRHAFERLAQSIGSSDS